MKPSILYPVGAGGPAIPVPDRRFAVDLNLDQVFAALNAGHEQLDFSSIFYAPLSRADDVAYRHEVLEDMERSPVQEAARDFGRGMRESRETIALARSLRSRWQQERLFVDAVSAYCDAVRSLSGALAGAQPRSRGLRELTAYIGEYCSSSAFTALVEEAAEIVTALGAVRYALNIRANRVTVAEAPEEPDYAQEIEEFFAKFGEGADPRRVAPRRGPVSVNQVEAEVLDIVARLNPGPFGAMDAYFRQNQGFVDPAVSAFYQASQFYLSYLDYIRPLREAGLPFCYPRLSNDPGPAKASDMFDLALAAKVLFRRPAGSGVVTNDFDLGVGGRVLVVTGPNNGGKTTFARAFGQLHYLASLGLPVPASQADLVLADLVVTSFGQAERVGSGLSHLEEELVNLHRIIERASARSVVVLNESLSSTTLHDAAVIGRAVLDQLVTRGALCVFVTFLDELAEGGEGTISMVAAVDPDDPTRRTYKILPGTPGGPAYAAALAERYGLTYRAVTEKVGK